jgi:hypothetical protein
LLAAAVVLAAPEPKADPKAKADPNLLAYSAPLVSAAYVAGPSAVYERSYHGNYAAYPFTAPYVAASPYIASPYSAASPYIASPYAAAYTAPLLYR